MSIWSSEIKELEKLYESFKGQLPDLEKELGKLIKADDENMILLYSRRCLEVIIIHLCECELKRERGTEPLKGIIDKLSKEKKIPSNIITSMDHLNSLSAYGAHPKDFDPEQVKPVLVNLDIIIKWYLKYKNIKVNLKAWTEEVKDEIKIHDDATGKIQKSNKKLILLISRIAIVLILIVAGIFLYPKIFRGDRLEYLRAKREISIAIMPFQNRTNDETLDYYQNGIQDILINYLSHSDELSVIQTESVNTLIDAKNLTSYASITPSVATNLSKKLSADVFVSGSINKAGNRLRLIANVNDSKTGRVLEPFNIECSVSEDNIFDIIDTLSQEIYDFMLISILRKDIPQYEHERITTNSYEALKEYTISREAFYKKEYSTAIDHSKTAIGIDSNFFSAYFSIISGYLNLFSGDQAKKWAARAIQDTNQMGPFEKNRAYWLYHVSYEDLPKALKFLLEGIKLDDQNPSNFGNVGVLYRNIHQYDKSIPYFEKSLEIFKKWESKPIWIYSYTNLGQAYHETGQYGKEKKLYKKAEKDYPGDQELIRRQAILALSEGKTNAANKYIEKYQSIRTNNLASEEEIANSLADIYWEADILDSAENYYHNILDTYGENTDRLYRLAWFLIDTDRDIEGGLENVNNALRINPDHYLYLDTKAWGLYKQGNYEEALEIINKADSLKPRWVYTISIHKPEIEKALASQKNN